MRIPNTIPRTENPMVDAIHIDIDAFFFQTRLQIVQSIQTAGLKCTGTVLMGTSGKVKEIGQREICIHLMQANHIHTEFGQTLSHNFSMRMGAEIHTTIEQCSKEPSNRTVFKHHFVFKDKILAHSS